MLRFYANHKRITERPWGIILLGLSPLGILAAEAFGTFDLSRLADPTIIRLAALILSGALLFFAASLWRSIRCEGKRLLQRSLFRPKELRTKQARVRIEEMKKGGRWQLLIDDGKQRINLGLHPSEERAQILAARVRDTLSCS